MHSGEQPDGRGFPRAVGTQEPVDRAVWYVQREVANFEGFSCAVADILQFDGAIYGSHCTTRLKGLVSGDPRKSPVALRRP